VIPSLAYLGPGEAEVISVALEQHVNLLLMDDHEGTREARQRGLHVVGTLAVLDRAAARSLVELPEVFRRLQTTTFRAPVRVMAKMLEDDSQRKR
jgi:predicted nucleic acid-binding protein